MTIFGVMARYDFSKQLSAALSRSGSQPQAKCVSNPCCDAYACQT